MTEVATIELRPTRGGTKLTFTEQGVLLDGHDDAGSREGGTRGLLDRLGASLARVGALAPPFVRAMLHRTFSLGD